MTSNRGRRPTLDDQKRRDICTVLHTGGTRQLAAQHVGCHIETIRRTAGRDPAFAEALAQAEAKSEMRHLALLKKAAQKDWRASAWALERLYPNQYARRSAETLTSQQVTEVVRQFAEAIVDHIDDPKIRGAVQRRLKHLAARLNKTGGPPRYAPKQTV
jgi:hypothetical protein